MRVQKQEEKMRRKKKKSSMTTGQTESAAESKKLAGKKKSVEFMFVFKLHRLYTVITTLHLLWRVSFVCRTRIISRNKKF